MHGRLDRAAGHGAAARNVDGVADGGGAHRVPRRRHRCMRLPGVRRGIVTLHLTEYGGLRYLAFVLHAVFAAHCEEAVAVDDEAVARARRGQRRALLPGVERGHVNMVKIGVVFKGVEAAADDMDHAVMGDGSDMVARGGEGFTDVPLVRLRIIDLMPTDAGALVGGCAGAADQMYLSVKRNGCGRPARPR